MRGVNCSSSCLKYKYPNEQGDIENFNITVEAVFKKPLTRQKTEAVKIQASRATHRMNSKAIQEYQARDEEKVTKLSRAHCIFKAS